jgi:peptide/nickel transport system substrate-binding protein
MNRRKFLGVSLAAATGAGLAACAQAPRAGGPVVVTQVVEKVVTATPAGPKQGGIVATYIGADPPGLDPCNPWNLGSGFGGLMGLVYEPWLTRDRAMTLQPGLARSWSQPDPTTAVFEIQPGVKFHSGRELVAEDVAWSYQRMINKDLGCGGASNFEEWIDSINPLETHTFEVKLKKPNEFITRIPLPPALDPSVVESYDKGPILLQAEGGTGPWVLADWVPQTSITFKRFADYWNKPPLLDEFQVQIVPDENAVVAAMRTGQLNFAPITKYENYAQLSGLEHLNAWANPSSGMLRLNVNWLREPLKDENVRQAIRYGVNRKQMVDTLSNGLGLNSGPVAPSNTLFALPQAEVEELQKFDPELAIDYMKKAGYDLTDNRLRLDCLSIAGFKNFTDVAQIVAANLKEIGIDVEIRIQEIGVWVDSRIDKKDYDLSINDYGHGPEPDFTFYRSDKTEQEWTGGGMPELDALIDAANAEPDEDKRAAIIKDIQRMIITKVREVYLYAPPIFEVAAKNFVGYEPWPGATDFRVFDRDQVYWAG